MISIIALPSNFVSGITDNTSQIITDLASPIELIIGILLGVMCVGLIIHFIKK
jgi:hypothetical protein